MSKYDIAIFIVCSIEGFICYLIGYKIGITHEKRTNTHECVKDTHYKTEPTISKMEQVDRDINVRSKEGEQMAISDEKLKIVINNYFKSECDVNTSIREAFEKGFRIGAKKGLAQIGADSKTEQTEREGE